VAIRGEVDVCFECLSDFLDVHDGEPKSGCGGDMFKGGQDGIHWCGEGIVVQGRMGESVRECGEPLCEDCTACTSCKPPPQCEAEGCENLVSHDVLGQFLLSRVPRGASTDAQPEGAQA
jgi:hypothetical protein